MSPSELPDADPETQLRFVELKRVYADGCNLLPLAALAETSARFMRFAREARDPRFLNAALKINDRLRTAACPPPSLPSIEEEERSALEWLRAEAGLGP